VEIAELLLSHGAKVDINDSDGHPPIYVAVVTEHVKVCRLLLQFGADARFKTEDTMRTLLAITTIDGNLAMVKLLLEYKADFDDPDTYGWTPIGHAAFKGLTGICRILISAGANLDLLVSGKTALTEAARAGHHEIVEMLLAGGAWGMPPPAYKGKWKNLEFKTEVPSWTREEILRTLRAAKHI
jgi:ankyrin repeat protein